MPNYYEERAIAPNATHEKIIEAYAEKLIW